MWQVIQRTLVRALTHDLSKLLLPERALWAQLPRSQMPPFGTPAYDDHITHIRHVWQLHVTSNDHHYDFPGPHSLLALLEMLCDWHARALEDGRPFDESLRIMRARHQIDPVIFGLLVTTAVELGWIRDADADSLLATE